MLEATHAELDDMTDAQRGLLSHLDSIVLPFLLYLLNPLGPLISRSIIGAIIGVTSRFFWPVAYDRLRQCEFTLNHFGRHNLLRN